MIKKIMLIDDDKATNLYHEIIISDEKLTEELVICSSVDDAIDILNKMTEGPEFIFLDMNMPLKNAWDFLDEYNAEKFGSQTKVVILSTTKNPTDVERAKNNKKVFGFLTKPLDLEFIKLNASKDPV